mgnify:CR=1 FL=1
MKRVISIGEALIDFVPNQKGCELKNVLGFERVAGGAPANVSAVVAKLGGKSNFISKLGKDAFGNHIIEVLKEANVNVDYVLRSDKANTGLAFVSLKEDGERDFSFYRNPSADMLLSEDEIHEEDFENGSILHFCSVSLIDAPIKQAHKKAIEYATKYNGIISFDPNVRLPLWESPEACRQAILEFLPLSNIVKISDEELESLNNLYKRGIENKVEGLKILDKQETLNLEPNLKDDVKGALLAPTGGIVGVYELTIASVENALCNGGELKLNSKVINIEKNKNFEIVENTVPALFTASLPSWECGLKFYPRPKK